MNDLLLWQLLRSGPLEAGPLVPLLHDLAQLPLAQRRPFLGLLPRALAAPDPAVRAASASALAGARGRLGLQQLVNALNDPGPSVRLAAVEALRISLAGHDGPRWAHVLFHPQADVRLAGLADDKEFPAPFLHKLFLLADDVCRPTVERQLAETTLSVEALPLLFDYLRRGLVAEPLARSLTARLTWADWLAFLADLLPRTNDLSASLQEAMQPGWADDPHRPYRPDRLDDVFHLFWAEGPPGAGSNAAFFEMLRAGALAEPVEFRQWVVFTLLGLAAQRKNWPPRAAEICAVLEPAFLLCPWVPLDVRRAALAGLYRAGPHRPRRPPDDVRPLLGGELCWTGGQGGAPRRLDLWAVGAILHLLPSNPYQHLLDWIGLPTMLEAFRADAERTVAFLTLSDGSSRGRRYLIRELCLQPGQVRGRVLAQLARLISSDGLDFLDTLDGKGACEVFAHVLELEGEKGLSANKTRCLAAILARKIAAGHVPRFLALWLALPAPEGSALGLAILGCLAHDHQGRHLLPSACALELVHLTRFLTACAACAGFPYDEEVRLAIALVNHPVETVRLWAERRLRDHEALRAARVEPPRLGESAPELRRGLVALLRERPDPIEPDVEVCQSLLASHDPPEQVAEQFARFAADTDEFATALDVGMVQHWQGEERLPLLGHVWLYRWDRHRLVLARQFREGLAEVVRWAGALPSLVLQRRAWSALPAVLEWWRWHDKPAFAAAWDKALGQELLLALRGAHAESAADLFAYWREHAKAPHARKLLGALRKSIVERFPGLSAEARARFASWIDASGLAPAPVPSSAEAPAVRDDEIRCSSDVDFLIDCVARLDAYHAGLAARCLLTLGEEAHQRLADFLLSWAPPAPFPLAAMGAIPDWPEGPPLEALRRLVRESSAPAEARFRIGQALMRECTVPTEARFRVGEALSGWGESEFWAPLLEAIGQPAPVGWFTADDWGWLRGYYSGAADELALAAVRSPHPNAHGPAVGVLVEQPLGPEVRQALLDFLAAGTERMREWRLQAAGWLSKNGERATALPILLGAEAQAEPAHPDLLAGAPPEIVLAIGTGVLMAGEGETAEEMLLALLDHGRAGGAWGAAWVDPLARQEALAQLMANATSLSVRQKARRQARSALGRIHKLRRVADTFAWGVRIGRQLTGKLFSVEMIAGEDLGYTRLRENRLFVSPLPLLRGHQNGKEVVRALILHEYGHHLYHKGNGAEEVWEQSGQERLQRLLNLVADEHLERNLRARDQAFGDQLKQLAAYAFQHNAREVPIEALLNGLRGRAFEVLTNTHLGVARKAGCVAVASGRLLLQMEKAGLSFARFFRALRMGLGNRHGDPKVADGLALFKDNFRDSTMTELMEKARKLREIFGDETDLLDSFNQDGALSGDGEDLCDAAEDMSNEELQVEVRRALEGGKKAGKREGDRPGGRTINLGADEEFERITEIKPQAHNPARHRAYAEKVARPAAQMRRYLHHLGLGPEPQRFRLRGKSFDKTRLRAVVLRGDPRMLVAREMRPVNDLFLGVLIDCSGSMASGENIEKAKLFGTLLAEAARGNRGVDLRLWGFTDRVIYDCGNAARPAVHDLQADDGNNDAAALWHAAEVARRSRRRAKLLVMISDGSPTQCTVSALSGLVRRLTRRNLLCAQVAVRPLDEICFPHYVLLEEDNPAESVRRFGAIVMRLVSQALRS